MVFAGICSTYQDNAWGEHPDTRSCQFKSYCTGTMNHPPIIFIPRPLHHCPSGGSGYRDNFPSVNKICTAIAPASNKTCTMMAKTTPWLLASRDYYCLKNHILPGWTAQPTLTTFHRRAVRGNSPKNMGWAKRAADNKLKV